ncbi:MAG: ABC transporter ATP-binding protein [Acidimicrobiales bacterium]
MSAIELRSVVKTFGSTPVLVDVDLTVEDGSLTAVLGESGSGKTTMLRVIAGFERVDSGTVSIGGRVVDDGHRSVHPQARGVGYVPQEGALFPHLNVRRNIAFGMPRADRGRVDGLLELVGLSGFGRRYPHQLSGGQQQRVALARALAIEPKVVLLDEPFSSLDATLRADLRRDVVAILERTRTTTVLVTHDQDEAMSVADRIAVLRRGRVVACESPRQLYSDPPDAAAAAYVGEANIVAATMASGALHSPVGAVDLLGGRPAADGPLQLMLRPEQLVLHASAGDGWAAGTVVDVQYHGHDALVTVSLDGAGKLLVARVPGDQRLEPGEPVWLEVRGPVRAWSA